jgi:hypothetical protein
MSPDAHDMSHEVFTWLSNTYYCARGPRPPDSEYAFAKFCLELLQTQGWSKETMAYVNRAYERLVQLKLAGHDDAAKQALLELKDSINFGVESKEGENSMHG